MGVHLGHLRKLAKWFKTNHILALELWDTHIYEARVIASMLFDSKQINKNEIKKLIVSSESGALIDELSFQIFTKHADRDELLDKWISSDEPRLKRAAWNRTIIMNQSLLLSHDKIIELLKIIESELAHASDMVQFAMNRCLCEIGIRNDQFTNECISIGEKLGVYKNMKVSKGCTSAYAPIWISVVRKKYKKS